MPSLIPSYQTLGPNSGWKLQRKRALPYPLCHDRTRYYYLGRNAIFHGAQALGLKAGDEVLFPVYHSGTESAPLLHLGLNLVYYGVDRQFGIDLAEIEAKITPATKAIYVIHFFGFPGPINELRALADRYSLALIEDVALSMLAHEGGRALGTWGDISVFCTYKNLPVANGGILAINRDDIPLPPPTRRSRLYSELNLTAKHVLNYIDLHGGELGTAVRAVLQKLSGKVVRRSGLKLDSPDSLDFDPGIVDWGMGPLTRRLIRWFNYRRIAHRRRANYEWLVRRLEGTGVVVIRPELPEGAVPLFLPILADDKFGLVAKLHERKIEAIPVWGIHHPYLPHGEFPDMEFLVKHAVEIPIIQDLSRAHLTRIADAITELAPWHGCESPLASTDDARLLAY